VLQDNTYRAQLYLKNKFGYTDKQQVEATNTNINIDIDTARKFIQNATAEEREKYEAGLMNDNEKLEIINRNS
jgi:hypothetical protein